MNDDGYDLKWKDHLHDVFGIVRKLRVRESFSDLVLHCGGKNFLAHKVILAASSAFFERALSSLSNRSTQVLAMIDTRPDMLQLVLDFVYNGETFVLAEQLEAFMETAEKLEVRGLRKDRNEAEAAQSGKKRLAEAVICEGNGSSSGDGRREEEFAAKRAKPTPVKPLPIVPSGIAIDRPVSDRPGPSSQAGSARASPERGISIKPVVKMVEPKPLGASELLSEHSNGEEDDEVAVLPTGAVKAELDDPLSGYANDGGEPADTGEWGEEGGYGEEEYYEGQYDESYVGGEGAEQPQNIPPEVSAEGIKSWNNVFGIWVGRQKDTNKRMYFCSACSYTTFATGNLTRHSRVHTGEKPYGCPRCLRRFSQKTSMKGHVARCTTAPRIASAGGDMVLSNRGYRPSTRLMNIPSSSAVRVPLDQAPVGNLPFAVASEGPVPTDSQILVDHVDDLAPEFII